MREGDGTQTRQCGADSKNVTAAIGGLILKKLINKISYLALSDFRCRQPAGMSTLQQPRNRTVPAGIDGCRVAERRAGSRSPPTRGSNAEGNSPRRGAASSDKEQFVEGALARGTRSRFMCWPGRAGRHGEVTPRTIGAGSEIAIKLLRSRGVADTETRRARVSRMRKRSPRCRTPMWWWSMTSAPTTGGVLHGVIYGHTLGS